MWSYLTVYVHLLRTLLCAFCLYFLYATTRKIRIDCLFFKGIYNKSFSCDGTSFLVAKFGYKTVFAYASTSYVKNTAAEVKLGANPLFLLLSTPRDHE